MKQRGVWTSTLLVLFRITSTKSRLEGKVAIVTGGARGIGACTARMFRMQGAEVVIGDILDEEGEAVAEEVGGCYRHCDVRDEEEVRQLVETAVGRFGGLDIMYSNAGVMEKEMGSIRRVEKSAVEGVVGVNLVGGFLAAKHAARVMIPRRKGCILFTASACAEIAGIAGHAYTASKHGLVGLMKSLAAEMGAHGIRVNCISPFGVLTDSVSVSGREAEFAAMMGMVGNLKGRIPKAEDIANAAVYLGSDQASYVSGINLVVDGAFSVLNPSIINLIQPYT